MKDLAAMLGIEKEVKEVNNNSIIALKRAKSKEIVDKLNNLDAQAEAEELFENLDEEIDIKKGNLLYKVTAKRVYKNVQQEITTHWGGVEMSSKVESLKEFDHWEIKLEKMEFRHFDKKPYKVAYDNEVEAVKKFKREHSNIAISSVIRVPVNLEEHLSVESTIAEWKEYNKDLFPNTTTCYVWAHTGIKGVCPIDPFSFEASYKAGNVLLRKEYSYCVDDDQETFDKMFIRGMKLSGNENMLDYRYKK